MKTKALIFTFMTLLPAAAQAGSRDICAIPSKQVQIEVDKIVPVKPLDQGITNESMALMIPTDIEPTNNSTVVGNEIMDHNMQNLLQGKYMRNNQLIQTAQKMQEVVQPKMTFGGGEDGGTEHSINMEYEAFQNVAKIKYIGFLKSDIRYEAATQDTSVSVFENLTPQTQVTMQHTSRDDLSYLKINWNW